MSVTSFKPKKDNTITEMIFDKNGLSIEGDTSKKIFAKITYVGGKESSYHVKTFQNAPFDPLGAHSNRENYIETKLKKVSKSTFNFYIMYLKTNNSIYMTKAQRGYLND